MYKINSRYDGFTPDRLGQRSNRGILKLGWRRYLDDVQKADEIWLYFKGIVGGEPGVYAKGRVVNIDRASSTVHLRVLESSPQTPLTSPKESARLTFLTSANGLQVFHFPHEWANEPECRIADNASSCGSRQCDDCSYWSRLTRASGYRRPKRLPPSVSTYTTGFWVLPRRSYYVSKAGEQVRRTSDVFYRFKLGMKGLGYPLALGVYRSLLEGELVAFDCVVPVPLSPHKKKEGELDRTLTLSTELARLLGSHCEQALELTEHISKRELCLSPPVFERRYSSLLKATAVDGAGPVLLLDDVATWGSTLRCCAHALAASNPGREIHAATAGLMITKSTVADEEAVTR